MQHHATYTLNRTKACRVPFGAGAAMRECMGGGKARASRGKAKRKIFGGRGADAFGFTSIAVMYKLLQDRLHHAGCS